jgi:hypothetical protein
VGLLGRPTWTNTLENSVVKRFLIAGAVLGAGLFVVAGSAMFGIILGTRAIVVGADAARPTMLAITAPADAGSAPVQVAQRGTATAGN